MSDANTLFDAPVGLPEDLREWMDESTLVHLLFEALHPVDPDGLDSAKGLPLGSPRILQTVLTYSYATGLYSSEEIERRILREVQLRYLAAKSCPSSNDLRRFRRLNRPYLQRSLSRLFLLAWEHLTPQSLAESDSLLLADQAIALESVVRLFELDAQRRIDSAVLADTMALDV